MTSCSATDKTSSLHNVGTQTLTKQLKKVAQKVPSPPKKPVKKAQQAVKKAAPSFKKAPAPFKKAAKKATGGGGKGWLGGAGGAQDLDKWYGEGPLLCSSFFHLGSA